MRCPKCGYISFDHMETCLKCLKDISGGSEVAGTTYHAEAPSFLRIPKKLDAAEENELEPILEGDVEDSSFELSDPDLDVLTDESEDFVLIENDEDEDLISLEEDSVEDEGIEFQFDLDEEPTISTLTIPDELSDISDLAPPSQETEFDDMELSLDEDLSVDTDLDIDDLHLDLSLGDDVEKEVEVESLSLDDIDLSEEEIGIEGSDLDGLNLDLDMDLNMDLDGADDDLGSKKDKSSSSLDGLSLSLD